MQPLKTQSRISEHLEASDTRNFMGTGQGEGKSGFRWDRNWDVMWAPPCRWPSSFMLDQLAQHIMRYPQLESQKSTMQFHKSMQESFALKSSASSSPGCNWSLFSSSSPQLVGLWLPLEMGQPNKGEVEAPWHEYMEGWKVLSSSQSLAMNKNNKRGLASVPFTCVALALKCCRVASPIAGNLAKVSWCLTDRAFKWDQMDLMLKFAIHHAEPLKYSDPLLLLQPKLEGCPKKHASVCVLITAAQVSMSSSCSRGAISSFAKTL